MQVSIRGEVVFQNSNGRQYKVIKADYRNRVAILLPEHPTFEPQPYVVVTGYRTDQSSWGGGTYDLTLEDAEQVFAEKTE